MPSDFNIEGPLEGMFDSDNTRLHTDSYTKLTGSYSGVDFSLYEPVWSLCVSQTEGMFIKVNRMPSLFMFDFGPVKGEWIHIIEAPLDELYDEIYGEFVEENVVPADDSESQQAKRVYELIDKHQVLVAVGEPVAEIVDDVKLYKYTMTVNQPALEPFLIDAKTTLDNEFGEESVLADFELDEEIKRVTSSAYVDFINTHFKFSVWARDDGIPVRLVLDGRLAIDNDVVTEMYEFDDDSWKRSQVEGMAREAGWYKNLNGSYEGYCESEDYLWYVEWNSEYTFDCNATADAFAVDVVLDEGAHCVDSTGYAGGGSILLVGDTVCTQELEEVVPAEPERQVNFSVAIEFTNINEPMQVEIPQETMSIEEAAEVVPILEVFVGGVLNNMQEAETNALDATAMAVLNNARVDAELHYVDNNLSYAGFCSSEAVTDLVDEYDLVITCNDQADAYVVDVELSDSYHCIDSTGYIGEGYTFEGLDEFDEVSCTTYSSDDSWF